MRLLDIHNPAYLSTKVPTAQELQSKDFLSGFEIMDRDLRMFLVEGMPESMTQFTTENALQHPNSQEYKLIYNPDLRFHQRLYA